MRREWQQMHGGIMIQYRRAKGGGNLGNGGFIDAWSFDKNKGDNYVVISLWLVTFLLVPYVIAPKNLAFNERLKMTKLVR